MAPMVLLVPHLAILVLFCVLFSPIAGFFLTKLRSFHQTKSAAVVKGPVLVSYLKWMGIPCGPLQYSRRSDWTGGDDTQNDDISYVRSEQRRLPQYKQRSKHEKFEETTMIQSVKFLESSLVDGVDLDGKQKCIKVMHELVSYIYNKAFVDRDDVKRIVATIVQIDRTLWDKRLVHEYLQVCFRFGMTTEPQLLFESILSNKTSCSRLLDTKALVIMINGFSNNGNFELAMTVFDAHRLIDIGSIKHTDMTKLFNAYFSALIKNSRLGKAESHFKLMQSRQLVDDVTLSIILMSYADRGNWQQFMAIWNDYSYSLNLPDDPTTMDSNRMNARIICRCQMVKCLVRSGQFNEALTYVRAHRKQLEILSSLLYTAATMLKSPERLLAVLSDATHYTEEEFSDKNHAAFTDCFASLLSGYLSSNRPDLVIRAFLATFPSNVSENIGATMQIPLTGNLETQHNEVLLDNVRVPSSVRPQDLYRSVKSFNIFLAAIKDLAMQSTPEESDIEDLNPTLKRSGVDLARAAQPIDPQLREKVKLLWTFAQDIIARRLDLEVSKQLSDQPYADLFTLGTAMDIANRFNNRSIASGLWDFHMNNLNGKFPNHQIACSYLRSFKTASHYSELRQFIPMTRINYGLNGKLYLPHGLNFGSRPIDEIINAYLRCGGLGDAIRVCNLIMGVGKSSNSSGKPPASKRPHKFSNSAITNMLIYFDRYWRDYNSETSWLYHIPSNATNDISASTMRESNLANRNIFMESRKLCQILKRKQLLSFADPYGYEKDIAKWAAVAAVHVSRGLWVEAIVVLVNLEQHYQRLSDMWSTEKQLYVTYSDAAEPPPKLAARALTLVVFSALEGNFPLLPSWAWELHNSHSLQSGVAQGLSGMLSSIPPRYRLPSGSKRTSASMGDVISFLESCADDKVKDRVASAPPSCGLSPNTPLLKVPIPLTLIQGLFFDAMAAGKYKDAARIIRILERARLVIDFDVAVVKSATEKNNINTVAANFQLVSPIETIRVTLAQQWAAMLLGKSLNKLNKDIGKSILKAAADVKEV